MRQPSREAAGSMKAARSDPPVPGSGGSDPTERDITSSFRQAARDLDLYWPGTSSEEAAERCGIPAEQIIKLASNENPYGTSLAAIMAGTEAMFKAAVYPSAARDYMRLRTALAEFCEVRPEMIHVAPGAETALRYLAQLFLNAGDEAIASPESFDAYAWASGIMGGSMVFTHLVDFRYDIEAVIGAVSSRTKVIWLCSPNNPTGTIVTAEEAVALVAAVPPTVAVIFDQAYREFVDDPVFADALDFIREGRRNVVVLRTLSKAFGLASLRIGYAVADPEICGLLDRIREPFNVSGPACSAAVAALQDGGWLRSVVAKIVAERQRMEEALRNIGCRVVPSQANFSLVETGVDADEFYERLLQHGVIVRPGSIWGFDKHARISVGTSEHTDRLLAAMSKEFGRISVADEG